MAAKELAGIVMPRRSERLPEASIGALNEEGRPSYDLGCMGIAIVASVVVAEHVRYGVSEVASKLAALARPQS
jgi:hypothetical protein